MPLRVRPSIRLANGVRLYLGKSGPSVTARAGRFSVSSRGTGSVRLAPGVSWAFGSRSRNSSGRGTTAARPVVVLAPATGFWLTLLGGWFGLHRFARHQVGLGIFYLLTAGLFGIGWIVDTIAAGMRLAKS